MLVTIARWKKRRYPYFDNKWRHYSGGYKPAKTRIYRRFAGLRLQKSESQVEIPHAVQMSWKLR